MIGRYDPVQCPDCGTWWRGDEHRCRWWYPRKETTKEEDVSCENESTLTLAFPYDCNGF